MNLEAEEKGELPQGGSFWRRNWLKRCQNPFLSQHLNLCPDGDLSLIKTRQKPSSLSSSLCSPPCTLSFLPCFSTLSRSCPGWNWISVSSSGFKANSRHPCPCAQPPCPIPLVGKAELYSSPAAPHPPLSVALEPPLKAQDMGASGQPQGGTREQHIRHPQRRASRNGRTPASPHSKKGHRVWCSDDLSFILMGGLAVRGPGLRCHVREWVKHHCCLVDTHSLVCLLVMDCHWQRPVCQALF